MDFSVLMSVYSKDKPEYYKVALESITSKQVIIPNQVVIVYDGPVSIEIERITDSEIKSNPQIEYTIIKQEKNQGLAAALNVGIEKCKYEYIARMDSDDISVPERFKLQTEFIQDNPSVDIIGGYISEFENDPSEDNSIRKVGLTENEIIKMAKRRTPFNHVTVMYKKKSILSVGGYSVDFGKLEDYKLWVDLISNGYHFANVDRILVKVRVGDGQLQRRSNKREIQDWDNLQKHLLSSRLITKGESIVNRLAIRVFTFMPIWVKKIAYKMLLRGRLLKS